MNIPKSRNQIRKEEQKWLFLGCLLSCCLWRRGGGGAEATDVEALDAAGEGRLRLHHALQFHDGPLRARRLVAPAPHPDLHRCFSYLYLVGLVNGEWWIGDLLSKQRMRRGRRWNFSGCWRQRWGTKLPLSRPFFPLFLFSSRQNQKKNKRNRSHNLIPCPFFLLCGHGASHWIKSLSSGSKCSQSHSHTPVGSGIIPVDKRRYSTKALVSDHWTRHNNIIEMNFVLTHLSSQDYSNRSWQHSRQQANGAQPSNQLTYTNLNSCHVYNVNNHLDTYNFVHHLP